MNEKSIDKIKELLKNAPDTALWWRKNRKFAQMCAFLRNVLLFVLNCITAVVLVTGLVWISISSESVLVDGTKIALCCVVYAICWFVYRFVYNQIDRHVFKRFEEGRALCNFNYRYECVVFLYENKDEHVVDNVLRALASIKTEEVQYLRPHIETLRTARLPQSWWYQMQTVLKDIKAPTEKGFIKRILKL